MSYLIGKITKNEQAKEGSGMQNLQNIQATINEEQKQVKEGSRSTCAPQMEAWFQRRESFVSDWVWEKRTGGGEGNVLENEFLVAVKSEEGGVPSIVIDYYVLFIAYCSLFTYDRLFII